MRISRILFCHLHNVLDTAGFIGAAIYHKKIYPRRSYDSRREILGDKQQRLPPQRHNSRCCKNSSGAIEATERSILRYWRNSRFYCGNKPGSKQLPIPRQHSPSLSQMDIPGVCGETTIAPQLPIVQVSHIFWYISCNLAKMCISDNYKGYILLFIHPTIFADEPYILLTRLVMVPNSKTHSAPLCGCFLSM